MLIYIVVFTIAVGLVFFSSITSHDGRPGLPSFVLSGVLVTLLLGLREGVGTDFYDIYVREFQIISEGFPSRFETGFVLLVKAFGLISSNYNFIFFGIAALTVGLVYTAIWKISTRPAMALFIYLAGGTFFFSTNGIRQALAVAILLNAVRLIQKGKIPHYVVLVLLAASVHVTAVVFLPLFLVRYTKVRMRVLFPAIVATVLLSSTITQLVLSRAGGFSSQLGLYAKLDTFTGRGDLDLGNLALCALAMIGYFMLRDKSVQTLNSDTTKIVAAMVALGVVSAILSGGAFILSRMTYYFVPFTILLVPNMISDSPDRVKGNAFACVYVMLILVLFIYLYGFLNFSAVNPYVSIFYHLRH